MRKAPFWSGTKVDVRRPFLKSWVCTCFKEKWFRFNFRSDSWTTCYIIALLLICKSMQIISKNTLQTVWCTLVFPRTLLLTVYEFRKWPSPVPYFLFHYPKNFRLEINNDVDRYHHLPFSDMIVLMIFLKKAITSLIWKHTVRLWISETLSELFVVAELSRRKVVKKPKLFTLHKFYLAVIFPGFFEPSSILMHTSARIFAIIFPMALTSHSINSPWWWSRSWNIG